MTIGFRVCRRTQKVDAATIEKYLSIPLANISDSVSRAFAGGPRLRPMHKSGKLAGAALTVRTRPGDNLMVHKALDMSEPGDVIVVDAGGDLTNAITGELMIAQMKKRGVVGVVVDGAIRDLGSISLDTFPVYAAGVTHRGPYRDGPGEINVPITLGGMIVRPGDLILGDPDGLMAVAYEDVDEVYELSVAKGVAEEKILKNLHAGTLNRAWVDETLKRLGCAFEE